MARERTARHREAQEPALEQAAAEAGETGTEYDAGPIPEVAAAHGRRGRRSASEQAYDQGDKPEIEASEQAMGDAMVKRMNQANGLDGGQYDLEHGIHYDYNFERECQKYGRPELWKDEYRMGHNASGHFINPHESGNWMEWRLKPGHSASKAIQAWLAGLTIAECLTSVIAMQIDTIRRAIGDKKFDSMFGSDDKTVDRAVPDERRLTIAQGATLASDYTTNTELAILAGSRNSDVGVASDEEKDKLLKAGDWYYFYNHPKYLLKHPGGAWQGENSLYMGKNGAGERLWSGLGASNKTEDAMVDEMVSSYNNPRDQGDERDMKERKIKRADGSYFVKKYDPAEGQFPDTVTRTEILNEPAYTIGGVTRKGGFLPVSGVTFEIDRVKEDRSPG